MNKLEKALRDEAMFVICAVTVLIIGFLFVLGWFGNQQFERNYKDSIARIDSLSRQVHFINQRLDYLHVELVDGRLIISSEARPTNVIFNTK